MKLLLVAVGHRMPAWVNAGFQEYARRMPPEAQLKIAEVRPEPRSAATRGARDVERLIEAEGRRIDSAIPQNTLKVVLDERGVAWSTAELARRLAAWRMESEDVAFIVGGADGLHDTVRRRAHFLWSLSSLTLPHGLVRVIVAEQLYRAHAILKNHPY
ncbi:MAG TPA: 23S rRNA (pseudouridine(1915)-N(3))-methyltransferase RlmH, partial [Burkholderiales bacterium]